MTTKDVLILGGGIIGLATAHALCQRFPDHSITVLEKEAALASHQTGQNSGVIHSGIYYKPNSLKASNCRQGKALLEAFCEQEEIPFERCGKVIVATHEAELEMLQLLFTRGQANGVQCRLVNKHELAAIEPHAPGLQAIHIPESGITDYKRVCQRLASRIRENGNDIICNARVVGIQEHLDLITVETSRGDYQGNTIINCTGLYSDRVTRLAGTEPPAQVIPFRGEYYELKSEAEYLCNGLIYPVPDPKFPFLGVHLTRMVQGGVECGPNAVLAFAREGYQFSAVNGRDLWETIRYPGFRKLAMAYWRTGLGEMWRSASKRAFVKALQKLVPALQAEHLQPAPAGVRAQVVQPDGRIMDDFSFVESERMIHVINAPSPAATASLSIGRTIAARYAVRLQER